MLYDASRVSNFEAGWFDPKYWRASGAARGEAAGRGSTLFFESGALQGALRHYRRGGLMATLRGDRFRFTTEMATRPLREFLLTLQLFRKGLPVPAPLACRYLRRDADYTAESDEDFLSHGVLHNSARSGRSFTSSAGSASNSARERSQSNQSRRPSLFAANAMSACAFAAPLAGISSINCTRL